jgi:hypothetical protein
MKIPVGLVGRLPKKMLTLEISLLARIAKSRLTVHSLHLADSAHLRPARFWGWHGTKSVAGTLAPWNITQFRPIATDRVTELTVPCSERILQTKAQNPNNFLSF